MVLNYMKIFSWRRRNIRDAEKYGVVRFISGKYEQKTHILSIQNPKKCPIFDYIKDGIKLLKEENSLKYQKYNVGDLLEFVYNNEKVLT